MQNDFESLGFEGDIVEHRWKTANYDNAMKIIGYNNYEAIGIVEWSNDNAGFIVRNIKTNNGKYFYDEMGQLFSWEKLKVIGDIHNNPELF